MRNLENHPAIETIKKWIQRQENDTFTINEIWQKALGRTSDVVKDENQATLRELHKVCAYAGLKKRIVRIEDKTFRVLTTENYNKSAL